MLRHRLYIPNPFVVLIPFPSMTSTTSNPCILNNQTFPVICHSEYPLTWPVSQFYRELTTPESGLQALLNASVTDITVYHRPGVCGPHNSGYNPSTILTFLTASRYPLPSGCNTRLFDFMYPTRGSDLLGRTGSHMGALRTESRLDTRRGAQTLSRSPSYGHDTVLRR